MKNINNYPVLSKNVLVRVDLNVPVLNGKILDNSRIDAIKFTIKKLQKQRNKIFLISHYGRPKGKINSKYSLKFICNYLKKEFKVSKINFLKDFNSDQIKKMINIMAEGEICLFENIRFYDEEEKNEINFAREISKNFDVYVNDAFSVSHRNHASIVGITKFLPSLAGTNMINEIKNINLFLQNYQKPNLAIIGGSKISSKINLLFNLVEHCDVIAIGGAMANTFLLAKKIKIGKSFCEENLSEIALSILKKAKKFKCKIIIPIDAVCANDLKNNVATRYCEITNILSNQMILDIGYKTTKMITDYILKSKTVLWNGPLGAFEYKPFNESSVQIANFINKNSKLLNILSIAGGGDTISVIKIAKAANGFSYISKAGGAFLEWLEGNESPGVLALKENNIN